MMDDPAELFKWVAGLAVFALGFILRRVEKVVDAHEASIVELHKQHTALREDMLRDYMRNDQIDAVKRDIIGRVDRLEASFTKHAETQEQRTQRLLEDIRDSLGRRG